MLPLRFLITTYITPAKHFKDDDKKRLTRVSKGDNITTNYKQYGEQTVCR